MQKYIVAHATLKDFWLSANSKLKKLSLSKLSLLQNHTEKKCKYRSSWELISFASDLKYCSTVSFQKKCSTLKVGKPMEDMKVIW